MADFLEDKKKIQHAFLVGIHRSGARAGEGEELLEELAELVENLDLPIAGRRLVVLREPQPAFLLGSGKASELIEEARALEADVIVIDEDLSPAQQRNWEKAAEIAVIDRHEVILEVFSRRAHTRAAVLQVALARMEYSLPRLKRAWTHLSRQRGGVTGARGQGETQLETDRRIVKERITALRAELGAVLRQREVQRRRRMRKPVPGAAIVGYTNAGKSTLLNTLTGSGVLAADKLFATLDPTTRVLQLPRNQRLLLTDTVGFIRRLPHDLVDAFKATLEEVVVADFLLHVIDASNPQLDEHRRTTLEVMRELGAGDKPVITVLNKSDACDSTRLAALRRNFPDALLVSARTGEGLEDLIARCSQMAGAETEETAFLIPHERYDLVARLHALGCVRREDRRDDGIHITASRPRTGADRFRPFEIPPPTRAPARHA